MLEWLPGCCYAALLNCELKLDCTTPYLSDICFSLQLGWVNKCFRNSPPVCRFWLVGIDRFDRKQRSEWWAQAPVLSPQTAKTYLKTYYTRFWNTHCIYPPENTFKRALRRTRLYWCKNHRESFTNIYLCCQILQEDKTENKPKINRNKSKCCML